MQYYNTCAIRAIDAHYNLVIGERSNGKTTALLRDIIEDWFQTGRKGAVVRQMDEDIKGAKGASLFNGVMHGNMVAELTDNEYQKIVFKNRAYYMVSIDDEGVERTMKEPFCYIFAISQSIHYKGNSYPGIGTILFDEFMRADKVYLADEVSLFLNLVSTLVRDKADAKIFLVANTVSWNSPYFKALRLRDVDQMKPGDLATFEYKKKRPTGVDIAMKVAIEYCKDTASYGGKDSDVYFVVDGPAADMITDGDFAIPEYPKCPHHFTSKNVKCTYWIDYDPVGDDILRCRLIRVGRDIFIFTELTRRSLYEEIADERRDLFYSAEYDGRRNRFISPVRRYADPRTAYLVDAIGAGRMFFSGRDAGEELVYYTLEAAKKNILTNQ